MNLQGPGQPYQSCPYCLLYVPKDYEGIHLERVNNLLLYKLTMNNHL